MTVNLPSRAWQFGIYLTVFIDQKIAENKNFGNLINFDNVLKCDTYQLMTRFNSELKKDM